MAARLHRSGLPPAAPVAFRPMVASIVGWTIAPVTALLATSAPSTNSRIAAPSYVAATWWYWPLFGSGVGANTDQRPVVVRNPKDAVPSGLGPPDWKNVFVGSIAT